MNKVRCKWLNHKQKAPDVYVDYHDNEWGVPVYDDRLLFEYLILEGAQAGLNWLTILKKRSNYKELYDNFDANKISQYGQIKKSQLLNNPGIIRNKLKIEASIVNAKAFLLVQKEFKTFSNYIWSFTNGKTIQNKWQSYEEIPTATKESHIMSQNLKKRGFKFVGATTCYAFMQAVGMVNDHTIDCYRHSQLN